MIKAAYTARELAALDLEGWPKTERAYQIKADKNNWCKQTRQGRGGGVEYPHYSLPRDLQLAIIAKAIEGSRIGEVQDLGKTVATEKTSDTQFTARALIVQNFRQYKKMRGIAQTSAMREYPPFYYALALKHPNDLPYSVYSTINERTLYRWLKAQPDELAGRYGSRKGTSVLKRANHGAVNTYIAGLLVENRHYKGSHIRDLVRHKFKGTGILIDGKAVELPTLRSFERHVQEWKEENEQLYMAMTAPGEFRNKMRLATGAADGRIEQLNQQWQIDASPADMLCKDGRYSIYAIIDVWSRRALFSVSKTAKTEASLLLVRKAIMTWGFPESIKTDNGSDFVSARFKKALLALGIEHEISPPFSPEKKSYVERLIHTVQHDLMVLLPGFAGHSVADRKRIQDQKDFAARLGESAEAAFSVELNSSELQKALDDWATGKYANSKHSGIGMEPTIKAATSNVVVRKPSSERALDILLAPIAIGGGLRTVTKRGIRIEGMHYTSAELIPYIGKEVLVRHDPQDLGRIYAFDANESFLFMAVNYETLGINPMVFAKELKTAQSAFIAQAKAPINKERKDMNRRAMADAILAAHSQTKLEAMPRPEEQYSNYAMDEAARAAASLTPDAPAPDSRELEIHVEHLAERMSRPAAAPEQTDEERWIERLIGLEAMIATGQPLSAKDAAWLEGTENLAWAVSYRNAKQREADAEAAHIAILSQKETPDICKMPGADQ